MWGILHVKVDTNLRPKAYTSTSQTQPTRVPLLRIDIWTMSTIKVT